MNKTQVSGDIDAIETKEWLDALASVIKEEGKERAQFIIQTLLASAQKKGIDVGVSALITPYLNTIPVSEEPAFPGDLALEAEIEAWLRWNAVVMVLKAKKKESGIGGHLSSYASIATLYEVGLNHFFHGRTNKSMGDLVYFQGHSAEGNYARAYLEGRLSEEALINFRQELNDKEGLSSYPHPWLMPNFWQFATVSLGLGLLQAVYQARFLKYLDNRHLLDTKGRKVWAFAGDGEMDEPESTAGLALAGREKLDNLIFVVNCNLQRLDGLVRSNFNIVQELESVFHGAGWQVIKVMWDSGWDNIFAKDKNGLLAKRLSECVDGDLQTSYVKGGAYIREFIFNTDELKALVADLSDDDLSKLTRGAHDAKKIYAAFSKAAETTGKPTVILAQGVKGFGLGKEITEGRNVAHNQTDLTEAELKAFRERFHLQLTDEELLGLQFKKPDDNSPAIQYLKKSREKLGGFLPARIVESAPLKTPDLALFEPILQGSQDRTMSTTMVLARIFNMLLKDKTIGSRIVPIFSDEIRTFGMEALFRQVGIYSCVGQCYHPEDKEQFLFYNEEQNGQILEEGITEAGCMSSWIAAATSYATNHFPMIPFFTYYAMFGFQRVGDLIWAASDMRARGFLIAAIAGRTTIEGEGLQHQDGSSLLTASTFPTCRAYDPSYGYEMAVIIQHGLKEMFEEEKDHIYYLTAMNERYVQPAMPEGVEEGIIKGMYLFKDSGNKEAVQLLGSGAILNEVIAASEMLKADFAVDADVWSVTSYSELSHEGARIERENRLHPESEKQKAYVTTCLENRGVVVAASDYVQAYPNLIRAYIKNHFVILGTDGFGRSDSRAKLRDFFEIDRYHIVVAALSALCDAGKMRAQKVTEAIKKYQLDPNKPNPRIS